MNGTELIVGAVIALWLGSIEWRLKNSINKDRFSDLIARIDRIEEKIDILLGNVVYSNSHAVVDKD